MDVTTRSRPMPGTAVFRAAAIVIVVQVLLDAFVLREPGVRLTEHLAGGLIVAGLVVLAAWAFPRLPPGGGAALAFVIGVLALVRGAVAGVDALDGDPSGDDWFALALLPTGAVLVALAVVRAWRSRRPGRWRWPRRGARALVVLLACYWVVFPAAVAIVATERPRTAPDPDALSLPHQPVTLETADGLRLTGSYVPSRNGAAVIAFPGRARPEPHARMLAGHGYGVLLVDMRGTGDSEGDPNAFGWDSRHDVDAAIEYLQRRPDVDSGRIGGLGLSVGGELMIETAASNPGLRAVVSEGAGERSVRETLLLGPRGWFALPGMAVQTAAVWLLSGDAPPPALDDLAAAIGPRPLLLVYGEDGQAIERELNPEYYAAAAEPKAIWEVPGAGHTGGIDARPADYERRIVAFFDRALAAG